MSPYIGWADRPQHERDSAISGLLDRCPFPPRSPEQNQRIIDVVVAAFSITPTARPAAS
ncbi:MAG: hypothetical protein ABMA25_02285 [Ilumatobacteraceae bacterium]